MGLIIMELAVNPNLEPEKSETNEFYGEYNLSEKLKFTSTAYRQKYLIV
jgi:outer membrane receptor protein involved in Fe transport